MLRSLLQTTVARLRETGSTVVLERGFARLKKVDQYPWGKWVDLTALTASGAQLHAGGAVPEGAA